MTNLHMTNLLRASTNPSNDSVGTEYIQSVLMHAITDINMKAVGGDGEH